MSKYLLSALSLFLFVASGCRTSQLYDRDAYPDPIYPFAQSHRGALIDAIPLEPLRASEIRETADLMTDPALSTFFDTAALKSHSYFQQYKTLRSSLADVLPVRIHFWSQDTAGRAIRLSAGLFLPVPKSGKQLEVPLVSWSHGTETFREAVPSRLSQSDDYMNFLLSSTGFAIIADDFAGLGDSDGYHPYCNEEALANSGVDAMKAATQYIEQNTERWKLSGRNYVFGYSEGGYAAMAITKRILTTPEENERFPLVAALPMAGPFDLSGVMLPLMTNDTAYSYPAFFGLMAFGFAQTDGVSVERTMSRTAIRELLPFFDGNHSVKELDAVVNDMKKRHPGIPVSGLLFDKDWLTIVKDPATRQSDRTYEVLERNNVYSWTPGKSTDIILAHSQTDGTVPYQNSKEAYDSFTAKGARVTLIDLKGKDHVRAGFEGILLCMAVLWSYESGAMNGNS